MSDVFKKLSSIEEDFKENKEKSTEKELVGFKIRLYDLYERIKTIREYCEFCKTDMTLGGYGDKFINGFYSGMVNGAIFVINAVHDAMSCENIPDRTDREIIDAIIKKLDVIQGLKED